MSALPHLRMTVQPAPACLHWPPCGKGTHEPHQCCTTPRPKVHSGKAQPSPMGSTHQLCKFDARHGSMANTTARSWSPSPQATLVIAMPPSGEPAGCGHWEPSLNPIVWCLEWPEDIRQQIISFSNPTGTLTNSDLEMAAMLLHYLVLEHLVDLKHVHVAAWCDNTPTVCWTNKLSSPLSRILGHLMWALAMHIHANEASPLISMSIEPDG